MYKDEEPRYRGLEKVKRLLRFLVQTVNDERIIGVDNLSKMQNFIDLSHIVHDNMRVTLEE